MTSHNPDISLGITDAGKRRRTPDAKGVYFPTTKKGIYVCINKDVSGIVCGGLTKRDKKSATPFARRRHGFQQGPAPQGVSDSNIRLRFLRSSFI